MSDGGHSVQTGFKEQSSGIPKQANLTDAGLLKVSVEAGGGTGGTASSFGAAFPGTGTAAGASDGANMVPLKVDGTGALLVSGGSGGGIGAEVTGTAVGAAVLIASTNVAANRWVSLQLSGVWGGILQADFEISNDNSTWVSVALTAAGDGSKAASAQTNGIWYGEAPAKYFRVNISSWGSPSGTVAGRAEFFTSSGAYVNQDVNVLASASNQISGLQKSQLYDAINLTTATVLPVSTAASASDNPVVVAQHPSSTGKVTVQNSTGAAAVNIQDGGNSITVDGVVTASLTDQSGNHQFTGAAQTLVVPLVNIGTVGVMTFSTDATVNGSALIAEVSVNTTSWRAIQGWSEADDILSTLSDSGTKFVRFPVAGYTQFRLRMSTFGGGPGMTAYIYATAAGSSATVVTGGQVSIADYASGNGPVTIKAASTAAAAADKALVVVVSPNNSVAVTNANLDVALSTRLKPADTLAAVTTVGTITNVVHVDDNTGSLTVDAVNLDVPVSGLLKPADTLTKVATVDTISNAVTVQQPTAASLNATVVQASGASLHVNVDSAPTTAVTAASLPLPSNAAQEAGGNLALLTVLIEQTKVTNALLRAMTFQLATMQGTPWAAEDITPFIDIFLN